VSIISRNLRIREASVERSRAARLRQGLARPASDKVWDRPASGVASEPHPPLQRGLTSRAANISQSSRDEGGVVYGVKGCCPVDFTLLKKLFPEAPPQWCLAADGPAPPNRLALPARASLSLELTSRGREGRHHHASRLGRSSSASSSSESGPSCDSRPNSPPPYLRDARKSVSGPPQEERATLGYLAHQVAHPLGPCRTCPGGKRGQEPAVPAQGGSAVR